MSSNPAKRQKINETVTVYKLIYLPSGDRYEGLTLHDKPHGIGTLFKETHCKINAHWTHGNIDATCPIYIKLDDEDIIEGTLNASMPSDRILFFLHATYARSGDIVFTGVCHFHIDTLRLCKDRGTVFVNGKKRATGYYSGNRLDDINLLFDENGELFLVNDSGSDGLITDFDGEWPRTMEGSLSVHKGDKFLYSANFRDGAIKNIIQVANTLPVRIVTATEECTDIISMDSIPFGEIAYELNSSHHVVSKHTLRMLRTTKNLRKHPCTRSPVLRISRVKYVKKET